MMRQAGRYLPEYRATRAQAGDFLSLCKTPELAARVTLQPVEILGTDAAILFSDILVLPLEMGMRLKFASGEGPVFEDPIKSAQDLGRLDPHTAVKNLSYVYETIARVRGELGANKALIGFCGAPWTVATYMIEGRGTKSFGAVKRLAYEDPELLHQILGTLATASELYLEAQIKAGANAVQIFDSWAGALEEDAFFEFSWAYIKRIVGALKQKYPQIPLIVFPKGAGAYMQRIDGDFDVFGVDWGTPMQRAQEILGARYVLQGNLEPARLYSQKATKDGVLKIASAMKNGRHIFNLGHGIFPDTPVENAKYFIDLVKTVTAR